MNEQNPLGLLNLPSKVYRRIEEDAANVLIQLNIRKYPVDPFQIAEGLGYILQPYSRLPQDALTLKIAAGIDAFSFFNPILNKFFIYYNQEKMKERLRFTIGHEIAHIRMEHRRESALAEKIADIYAAYLLAPSPWIAHAKCDDYKDLAHAFCLSDSCAGICFDRYERWKKLPHNRRYEKALHELLS